MERNKILSPPKFDCIPKGKPVCYIRKMPYMLLNNLFNPHTQKKPNCKPLIVQEIHIILRRTNGLKTIELKQ